jgi:hypothetical protein
MHFKIRFPKAEHLNFSSFNNRYLEETCYLVGRGPTEYNYNDLYTINAPVFFINDAVLLDRKCPRETFFFAHDHRMLCLLDKGIKSIAIFAENGKLFKNDPQAILPFPGKIILYRWRQTDGNRLLRMSRDEISARQELYTHTGTIHSALHFIWYCGFKKLYLIGCDGLNERSLFKTVKGAVTGYDSRLENISETTPWWQYQTIREVQNQLITTFSIDAAYLGTPVKEKVETGDPQISSDF